MNGSGDRTRAAEPPEDVLERVSDAVIAVGPDTEFTYFNDSAAGLLDIDESALGRRVADSVFGKGEKGFASPGTGFGLYIVREVVEPYGGSITVEDAPELGGARFEVRVPLA